MTDTLFMDEEQEIKRLRESEHKKNLNDLNRKNLSKDELDEIFCEY